ncbi:CBO0543 family protein [Sporomusa malonica]|uniref:Uncharacterized protein n=1 Tax=Sporomusa malonica TaxID=112901 RepID=A0A1W1ZK83_9FIRM|nr:CBO0543 family protein [Sporomusa malonica]SMC48899.1 hypothetical protein SAMN04488500_10419 [Sporomusa malonica]
MNTNELFHQLQLQIWNITWTRYINEELFSNQWWGMLILLSILYAVWIKLLDKSRTFEILLFGSFVAVQAVLVDIVGFSMGLWQHNIRLIPIVPGVFPIDFTVVPILLMFAHQYGSSWTRYLTWSALASILFSSGISPAFQLFGIKAYYNWNFIYFFFLMMVVAIISRAVIQMIAKVVQINSTNFSSSKGFSLSPQPAAKRLSYVEETEKDTQE